MLLFFFLLKVCIRLIHVWEEKTQAMEYGNSKDTEQARSPYTGGRFLKGKQELRALLAPVFLRTGGSPPCWERPGCDPGTFQESKGDFNSAGFSGGGTWPEKQTGPEAQAPPSATAGLQAIAGQLSSWSLRRQRRPQAWFPSKAFSIMGPIPFDLI